MYVGMASLTCTLVPKPIEKLAPMEAPMGRIQKWRGHKIETAREQNQNSDKNFGAAFASSAIYQLIAAEHVSGGEQHKYGSWFKEFICESKISDIAIAFFTWCLMVVTAWLAWATLRLWSVTKIAADAAKTSAESLPIIEGAYVYPVIVFENIADSMGAFEQVSDLATNQLRVLFKIKNFGKTPAIVLSCNADLIHPDQTILMRAIDYEGRIIRDFVLGAGEETKEVLETEIKDFRRAEFASVKSGDSHVTFNGHVAYADIFGNTWIYRFDWQYGRVQKRLMPDNQPGIKKS